MARARKNVDVFKKIISFNKMILNTWQPRVYLPVTKVSA